MIDACGADTKHLETTTYGSIKSDLRHEEEANKLSDDKPVLILYVLSLSASAVFAWSEDRLNIEAKFVPLFIPLIELDKSDEKTFTWFYISGAAGRDRNNRDSDRLAAAGRSNGS